MDSVLKKEKSDRIYRIDWIVERKGTPMVAIIPVKKLQQMDRARLRFFKNMSKISESFSGEDAATLENMLEEATTAAKKAERP